MNENGRYLMGLYQVALLIGNALDYSVILPIDDQDFKKDMVNRYETRAKVYDHFIAPGSPIDFFCEKNKNTTLQGVENGPAVGVKIMDQLREFSTDVYGNNRTEDSNTPIVSLVSNAEGMKEVRVESSKINHLFDMIAGLHQTVVDTIYGHLEYFNSNNVNDPQPEFIDLLSTYEPYYVSNFMVSISINIAEKFGEYNNVVKAAIENARRNGVDTNSPSFKLEEDPTIHFVISELNQLLGLVAFVKGKIHYKKDDVEACFTKYEEQLEYFKGVKPFPEGKTTADVLKDFYMIFNNCLSTYSSQWKDKHEKMYGDLVEFERKMREELQKNQQPEQTEKE